MEHRSPLAEDRQINQLIQLATNEVEHPMKSKMWMIVLMGLLSIGAGCQARSNSGSGNILGDFSSMEIRAREEGTVNIWATNAEDIAWIPAAFEKDHPGVSVEIFTDLSVSSRVIIEDRAGRHAVDVVWNSEALVQPLIERDLLVEIEWEALGIPAEDIGADGHMAITNSMTFAVAYRTDLIEPLEAPATWETLTSPTFRGRMAASPFLFARLCAALAAFEGEPKWRDYARLIRHQSETLWTNDLLESTIVSGERTYVVGTANYLAERWKARGLPIEVVIPEPVFIAQFGAAVLRKAPHPNAARLLTRWLASPAGRAARETHLLAIDLRPTSTHPTAEAIRTSGKRLYIDNKSARDRRNNLIPIMDRVLSGAE